MDFESRKRLLAYPAISPLKSASNWKLDLPLFTCHSLFSKRFKKRYRRLRISTWLLLTSFLLFAWTIFYHSQRCPVWNSYPPWLKQTNPNSLPKSKKQEVPKCSQPASIAPSTFHSNSIQQSLPNSSLIQLPPKSGQKLQRRLPQCIIIGARKAGTRALLEYLSIHRQIRKADAEVHFFDNDDRYRLGLDFYRRSMPYSRSDQITVEKTPAYFVTPDVPNRIYAMNSSIRLVLIVRDPVERLISDFAQLRLNRLQKIRNMQIKNNDLDQVAAIGAISTENAATNDYLKGAAPDYGPTSVWSISESNASSINQTKQLWTLQNTLPSFEQLVLMHDGQVNVNYKPVKTSIYSLHLYRWLQVFHKHQLHVVDGDRLIKDPFSEMKLLEQFLGLSSQIRPKNFVFNVKKNFFCVRQIPNDQVLVEENISNQLWPVRCLNSSKGRKHPFIASGLIRQLRQFYAPYNRHFYQLVGRHFDWPTK